MNNIICPLCQQHLISTAQEVCKECLLIHRAEFRGLAIKTDSRCKPEITLWLLKECTNGTTIKTA